MLDLRRVVEVDLPAWRGGEDLAVAPGERGVGLRGADGLVVHDVGAGTGEARRLGAVALPDDAGVVALSPDLTRVAFATSGGVSMADVATGTVLKTTPLPLPGTPRALGFAPGGQRLWLGAEGQDDPSSGSLEEAPHAICALDAASLAARGCARVGGIDQGYHELSSHPTRTDVVAVDVACGQDGAWLTFVEESQGHVRVLLGGVAAKLVGFRPDGAAFACMYEDGIKLLSFPAGEVLAQHDLHEDEHPGFVGFFSGSTLHVLVDREEGCLVLRALDAADLTLRGEVEVPLDGDERICHLGPTLLVTCRVTYRKRLSPADRKPERYHWRVYRLPSSLAGT